jgi:hypothetical protein
MVIPAVMQTGIGSTQSITDICPERGIERGFRGLNPSNRIVKRMVFYVSGKFSPHRF